MYVGYNYYWLQFLHHFQIFQTQINLSIKVFSNQYLEALEAPGHPEVLDHLVDPVLLFHLVALVILDYPLAQALLEVPVVPSDQKFPAFLFHLVALVHPEVVIAAAQSIVCP